MSDFRKLKVWQLAHGLSVDVYQLVCGFPADERFGLRSQVVRSAGSVAANLAEGCGRSTTRDLARFVDIALGSAYELECHLLRARDLEFVSVGLLTPFLVRLDELQKMLSGMRASLRRRFSASGAHSPLTTRHS
jgi:four helix bundle protein